MSRLANVVIHESELSFSAGHFTIFSATEREPTHGHNYHVKISFDVIINENGMSFDYRYYKQKLKSLCAQLNFFFLLPKFSPYLTIQEQDDYWVALFNQKKLFFLKEDTVILPITNVTIEELSHWFLDNLLNETSSLKEHNIQSISLHVYNGPGQSGGAFWESQ